MHDAISKLANGLWWEPVLDLATHIKVRVNDDTGDIFLVDIHPDWKPGSCLPLDHLDSFTAQLEMAFHGFGGGSARMTELLQPTMFHCVFSNHTIYYSLASLKGFTTLQDESKNKWSASFLHLLLDTFYCFDLWSKRI